MSQLARRENAPHRAAFVTSLSRWYIRRLLGNLPPFHPCLSAERRPRIASCGTSPPYGHTPRKSRHGKPFLPSSQYIRNWSGLSAAECPITGDVFYAASSPGIALDRPWPTLSRATTIRSRRTRTVSAGSSSHGPERHGGGAILLFCGKSRSQRVGCRTIHHERRSGWANISDSARLWGDMDFHQSNWK